MIKVDNSSFLKFLEQASENNMPTLFIPDNISVELVPKTKNYIMLIMTTVFGMGAHR